MVRFERNPRASLVLLALIAAPAAVAVAQEGLYRGESPAVRFDVSPPLREMTPIAPRDTRWGQLMGDPGPVAEQIAGADTFDPVVQPWANWLEIPSPSVSFNGPSNLAGVSPPDPVGDIGPNHYVAMSNLFFQIFDRTGASLLGPLANNTLWAGFGGDCQTDNSGDPIVIYDQLADRWILSQFTASGPTYFNCVAVSQTPDPTGSYYRYAFSTGSNFPDYPKYGIWPDALYISTREFAGASFAGVGAYAVNRAQLIAGNPAPQVISFLVTPGSAGGLFNIGDGLLPTDLDGSTLPPAGSPNYFVGSMDSGASYGAPQDALTVWRFHADFTTPASSTFVLAATVPVAAFDSIYPCTPGSRDCLPQPGTTRKIDILSYRQRPTWRLAYRNFGTHESLVTNQSVEAAPSLAGIRWYEIRDPNGTPVIHQQGTYAPGVGDGIHRWMGSIAMDRDGNMALGYSASDATSTFPSVWYTGRLASDPLGTLPQGEAAIINGTGSQTGSGRWGDYTSMNVDPVDDCTFWYVNEWVPVTSSVGWQLRVGAFKFPECGSGTVGLCSTPALAIPDNTPAGVSDNLIAPSGGTILDLDVSIAATHTWVGDLIFTVTHVDTGTSVVAYDRPGRTTTGAGCSGDNIDVNLNDEGVDGDVESQCDNLPASSGDRVGGDPPSTSLFAAFDGEDLAGTWTITVSDNAGLDTGTLDEWCLVPTLDEMPFIDGFESGDTSAWSSSVP